VDALIDNPYEEIGRIRAALAEGKGVRETARLLKVSAAKVSEVNRMMKQPDQAVAVSKASPFSATSRKHL
jgi:hypothetical protein